MSDGELVDDTPMADSSTSGQAVRGASLLILLQVASRAVTFVANQLLLRFLTARTLGVSAQLEAYYLTVLFFARESLRVAIQRQAGDADDAWTSQPRDTVDRQDATAASRARTQAAVNLAYLCMPLGSVVAALFGWLYLASVGPSSTPSSATAAVSSTPFLVPSLYLYALAALVELLSEPAFVVMQIRLQFAVRARAEAVATFVRCALTLASAVWAASRRSGLDLGVLPFALGQAGYGATLLAVYLWYGAGLARREGFSLLPVKLDGERRSSTRDAGPRRARGGGTRATSGAYVLSYFDRPTLQLASSMMAQSLVKHLLTQGDTFLVSVLSTPAAQGVYALANNYGGLVARLLFQPVEESSRSYFSRLLAGPSSPPPPEDKTPAATRAATGPDKAALVRARADLQSLLRAYLLLSLVVTTLGPAAAPRLLALVAGPRWSGSGAASCLAAYAWYVPLLAVNGVAEAFVASVATEAQVHAQSAWMAVFSLAFAAAGYVALHVLRLGAVGLVWANAVNMACRIAWCAVFIARYFRSRGVPFAAVDKNVLPGPWSVLASVVAAQLVRRVVVGPATEQFLGARDTLVELVKIAVVALPYLAFLAFLERPFLLQGVDAVRNRRAAKS